VTSTDKNQLTHVVNVLGEFLGLTNPLTVIESLVTVVEAVALPPPGDPARCRALATAFRGAGSDTTTVGDGVQQLATGTLPSTWQGTAGASASQVLQATVDLLDAVQPSLVVAAAGLEAYAATLQGLLTRHAQLTQQLREIWHEATHIKVFGIEVALVDLPRLTQLAEQALQVVAQFVQVYDASLSAADELEGQFADCKGRARAAPDVAAGSSPNDAVVLADTMIGSDNLDSAVLPPAQAARAAALRDQLSPQDRAALDALLARASSPQERAYLLKAFAAGHSVAEVTAFDAKIHDMNSTWLQTHLSLVDPSSTGTVLFNGTKVQQLSETTCGSTSIVLARAMADPLYAFQLTTGGDPKASDPGGSAFAQRLAAEEQRTHDATNTLWPQALGTTPWGMASGMNAHSGELGTQYTWRLVDDTSSRSVDPALSDAVKAVDAGQPVPVLIGDSIPRHYVLMIGHDGNDLLFYNPSGEVTRISEQDFRNGNTAALGFSHVQGVILPKA
jgi:hypothetical protein